ncbi:pseudouridine synthase [Kalaharituber pfeilii]|nr:pseudouridine synthase [Kalaharituber pfeilii]
MEEDYTKWTHSALVARVQELEEKMAEYPKNSVSIESTSATTRTPCTTTSTTIENPPSDPTPEPKPKKRRAFDPNRYSTRLIALKIAYLGSSYSGFEYQANNFTPLPTVEEKIFEALLKSHLVPAAEAMTPNPGEPTYSVRFWPSEEVTQYSKGGRTDRGVSGFGQVIGIRVRSNRPLPKPVCSDLETQEEVEKEKIGIHEAEDDMQPPSPLQPFDDIKDELPYVTILNRLLPPDIRVLAWAPNPPENFSARFNCRGRHYRYFFSNPPIAPRPLKGEIAFNGPLDIERMREAASYFLGEHDFRNFCKLDASKQINNFRRIIYASTIEELPVNTPSMTTDSHPKMYYFNLHGSAFLWHQVRHMIAVLFLIGQGFEEPSLIKALLDTEKHPRKPQYEIADDKALVLWDCYYPNEKLQWVYGEIAEKDSLYDTAWMGWHKARLEEILWGVVEDLRKNCINAEDMIREYRVHDLRPVAEKKNHFLVDGGSRIHLRGKYVPVMKRATLEDVEVLNARYRHKKPERVPGMNKVWRAKNAMQPKEMVADELEKISAEDTA